MWCVRGKLDQFEIWFRFCLICISFLSPQPIRFAKIMALTLLSIQYWWCWHRYPIHWTTIKIWAASTRYLLLRIQKFTHKNMPNIKFVWIVYCKWTDLCLINLTVVGMKWMFFITGFSPDNKTYTHMHANCPATIIKRSQPCNQHLMRIIWNVVFVVVFDIGVCLGQCWHTYHNSKL